MTTLEHISKQIRAAGLAAEQKESIEVLQGGEGDGKGDEAFDPAELAKGIKVEICWFFSLTKEKYRIKCNTKIWDATSTDLEA
jgi:hypothetical protein